MAKKALVNKANKKPKFAVRAYTRSTSAAARTPCTASSACAESACERWRMPANCRVCRSPAGEEGRTTMTMTDPIADFLTRLRNANSAYHDEVSLPHSKIKANIAEILKREGYISDFRTEDARVGKSLVVKLKYGPNRERSLAGLRRVSKPGLRVYAKSTNLPRVLGGLGVAIISTSSGLRTDRQAAREGVGGEVLAYVW
jgi:small subunit ribosomal protein S8